jgi:gluconolactonase
MRWLVLAVLFPTACAATDADSHLGETRTDSGTGQPMEVAAGGAAGELGSTSNEGSTASASDASSSVESDAGVGDAKADSPIIRREAGPNPYEGMTPVPGTPVSLGNTKIFDDSTGVVWNAAAGELLFTVDQINNIWRWRPNVTTNLGFDIVRHGGEKVFGMRGLAMTSDHALVVCEAEVHRVTRSFPGYDTPVALADHWPGGDGTPAGRFNSPFDVVARDDGNIYFTDPVTSVGKSPDLDFTGIYRIDPSGKISLAARDLEPWAVALSADHNTLFVSTGSHKDGRGTGIYKFPILDDGSLGPRSLFASASVAGTPGGLAVDQAGNVYHAFFAVNIIRPDGTKLGTSIQIPGAADCAFGGDDLKTLFVTAGSSPAVYNLWRVPLNVPGVP